MTLPRSPQQECYDVVIVGGAMLGAAVAWFTASNPDFDGALLVIERDPSYEFCSTAHTNSCIRQQFSSGINIRISQFAAQYIKNFKAEMEGAGFPDAPAPVLHSFGYMYLADSPTAAGRLQRAQRIQAAMGAGTRHLGRDEIARACPFYNLDDILCANHNCVDEGYFEGQALFESWKRAARQRGVESIANEVVSLRRAKGGRAVESLELADGTRISCGAVINCTGPRAAVTARMAGIEIPVEPRKRFSFVFQAETPLEQVLPLTIDPSGVHMRSQGAYYLAGCPPDHDHAVDFDDFAMDHSLWEEKVWPALAHRIPAFERIRQKSAWAGHYAYNTLDQNAIIGAHPHVKNFFFANGFSGHGLQQAPAVGRAISELILYGTYRTLDLSPLGFTRIQEGKPLTETAII